jgi:hypothetical protein
MGYHTNLGDNNLYIIRHIASQTGSTPVHLNKESIEGLRNLHNLVHNEDVEHDFSKLKTLFAQPNIAVYLKGQIQQKKANGGIINDYINTLKHNGSEESSELSLAPNELIKFLDDSGYPYMTNPHTGHKEYHLGKMFDGLNNIFKPVKDSMRTREHHGWGDMIGGLGSAVYNAGAAAAPYIGSAASTLGNAAYNVGAAAAPYVGSAASTAYDAAKYAAPIVGNAVYNAGAAAAPYVGSAASTLGNAAYDAGAYAAPIVGNAAYNVASNVLGKDAAEGLSNAASTLGNAAYNVGAAAAPYVGSAASTAYDAAKYAAPIVGNAAYNAAQYAAPVVGSAASTLGNAAYDAGKFVLGGTNPAQESSNNTGSANAASQPSFVQNVMRGIAGPIGGAIGGLGGQFAGQKVGQKLGEGIPLVGPFISPITGNIAGNLAYKAGAYKGRNKGVELADRFYNYLGGGTNPAPAAVPSPAPNSSSYFPTLSGFGNTAYNTISNAARAAYDRLPANPFTNLGTNAYNTISNAARAAYDRLPANPFTNLYNQ